MRKVIAVVGPIASGKGALIELLKEKGYQYVSLSDVVREKTKIWGLALTRENLQNVGDKLRKQFHPAILAELASHPLKSLSDGKFVIDSVRNPAEVRYLQKHFSAMIIGITASPQKRFEMMKTRGREWDPETLEEFKKAEERDRGLGQESFGQQVDECLKMADLIIDNNGTLQEFQENLRYFLKNNL